MSDPATDILNRLPLGVVMADPSGKPLLMNRAAESLVALCGGRLPVPPVLNAEAYCVLWSGRRIELSASPIEENVLFTLKDVTESMRREALEKQRERSASMGEAAAGIAHEIRNPLGTIELFASLLKKGLKKEKDLRRIDQILSSVKAVNNEVSRLILSSRSRESFPISLSLHDILREIMLYSEQVIDCETIYISLRTAETDPVVEGDLDMIRQIFLSLIHIALQSLPVDGRLEMETVHIPVPPSIEVHFRAAGREFLERVSGTEAGAGMGLAIIHHIMTMHRGSVRIEQDPGRNTSFILSFPLSAGKAISPLDKKS